MALYRYFLLSLLIAVLAPRLLWRLALGRESLSDCAERLGRGPTTVARGPVVWLHGASVGELVAARGIAEELLRRDPRLRLIVTANTATGRAQARSWGQARVEARLAPVDTRWALARFLAGWQPVALITTENEIRPNRMAMAKAGRVPVLVAGARMSERSARLWGRFPGAARDILGLIDHVAPQDDATAERFRSLGLPPRRIGARLNLKAGVQIGEQDPAEIATFARAFPRGATVLAASTHPGEEEIILTAFRKAREFRAELKLILAPRHPERGDQLAALASSSGQPVARRSKGEKPGPKTSVYLADTMGEMGLWYRLAAVTFVGGSLVMKGGHTPFEPAACGSAILHGPHVANNADAYRALKAAKGAVEVLDAGTLTAEILRLLGNPEGRDAMAERAARALADTGTGPGAIAGFVARIGAMTGNRALETTPGD